MQLVIIVIMGFKEYEKMFINVNNKSKNIFRF